MNTGALLFLFVEELESWLVGQKRPGFHILNGDVVPSGTLYVKKGG